MKTNPITVAAKAKSPLALFKRARTITKRYGITVSQIDQALQQFVQLIDNFKCGATFPITASTLERHGGTINKYLDHNIEFAVHGCTHVDYTQFSPEEQHAHLKQALQIFRNVGITPMGFRSPYLSQDDHLYTAIKAAGFAYVSNQPILWDVFDTSDLDPLTTESYQRALSFYDPWHASERPSLPRLDDQLVEIPVSLPDDEILIERLASSNGVVEKVWRQILSETYQRGELFTLQLHPERISLCADGLSSILREACMLTPSVWCARLDEISAWWKARYEATIEVSKTNDGGFCRVIYAPKGTTVLVRAVEVSEYSAPWMNGYREVKTMNFSFKSPLRPFIGFSPSTSTVLTSFLRQQGYIVEASSESERYSYYINQVKFDVNQEQTILAQIERSGCPLIRLGRWPNAAQSALAVTGDIDALTLWDYGLRLFGK